MSKGTVNPWKVATLAFAVGIVVVAGNGVLSPADAAPQVHKEALQALGMVEAANRHLWKAPKDEEGHRQKAFEAIKLASHELKQLAMPTKKAPAAPTALPPVPAKPTPPKPAPPGTK